MWTYAVIIYGWLICKLSIPQRTIESTTNNTNAVFILTGDLWYSTLTWFVLLYSVNAIRKHIAHDNVPRYNHHPSAFISPYNISVFINWVWYIYIVTVNERKYIMVVMQLSVSIDCPFLIATFSSVYINLLHD
jgi:hypothetical protein